MCAYLSGSRPYFVGLKIGILGIKIGDLQLPILSKSFYGDDS